MLVFTTEKSPLLRQFADGKTYMRNSQKLILDIYCYK